MKDSNDLKGKNLDSDQKHDSTEEEKSKENQKKQQSSNSEENVIEKLNKKIADLEKKNDHLQDQFLRSRAEIDNMNNHFKKERTQLLTYGSQNLAQEILPGIDNLKRALATETKGKSSDPLKKGIEMVLKQLNEALKSNDIVEISESGVKFDPTIHQAVSVVEATDDDEKDTVKEILQSGYKLKDRVIRPAMVVVIK